MKYKKKYVWGGTESPGSYGSNINTSSPTLGDNNASFGQRGNLSGLNATGSLTTGNEMNISNTNKFNPNSAIGYAGKAASIVGNITDIINNQNSPQSTGLERSQKMDRDRRATNATIETTLATIPSGVTQAVAGVMAAANAIGEPIKAAAEKRNDDGTLANKSSAQIAANFGNYLNPINRFTYPGGLTDFDGSKYIEQIEGTKADNPYPDQQTNRSFQTYAENGGNIPSPPTQGLLKHRVAIYKGETHANGGIAITPNDEVEKDEVGWTMDDGNKYIYSNKLINTDTGRTYAYDAKQYLRQLGKQNIA